MDQETMAPKETDHGAMGHGKMGHEGMDHSKMDMKTGPDPHGPEVQPASAQVNIKRGPGVANVAAMPVSRLDEPGLGLADMPHRTLRYNQLRSLEPNPDTRKPAREVIVHLTSNMERYMWSFDGVKFSEVTKPITFHEGERLRLTLVNNTMMPHPIHLHGMFFDLVIPDTEEDGNHETHRPRKHTVIVKPGERVGVDISADNVGDWAFHCHLLYHMHAGMMQVVSVLPRKHAMSVTPDDPMPAMMDQKEIDHSAMGHGSMKTNPNKGGK